MNRIVTVLGFFLLSTALVADETADILTTYLRASDPEPALGRLMKAPGAREILEQALASSKGRDRTRITVALCVLMDVGQLGKQVTSMAKQDPFCTRIFAAALEAQLRDKPKSPPPGLTAAVEKLAGHDDWRLRLHAAGLAAFLEPDGVAPVLQKLLKDSVWPVRCRALESLAAVPVGDAIAVLEPVLRDRKTFHVTERLSAARAARRLQHVPTLLLGLDDPDRDVRFEVLAALDHCPSLPNEAMVALEQTLASCRDDMVKGAIQKLLEKRR